MSVGDSVRVASMSGRTGLRARRGSQFLWRRIEEALAREVDTGALQPGEALPAESALARRFSVHRNTVRRAIEALQAKGLVRTEQGRGSFVRERLVPYRLAAGASLTETLRASDRVGQRRVLGSLYLRADAGVAASLELAPGDPILAVRVLTLADGRPVTIAALHFRCRDLPASIG